MNAGPLAELAYRLPRVSTSLPRPHRVPQTGVRTNAFLNAF